LVARITPPLTTMTITNVYGKIYFEAKAWEIL